MANLTAWYDEVLAQAAGCPSALADNAIRNAAIEFCERSHAHIVDLTAINAVAATADYALTAPASTEIIKVLAVEYDGEEIRPISPRDVARRYGENWKTLQERPERYMSQYGTSLKLVPMPDTSLASAIIPTVILKPTRSVTAIDDVIATPHFQTIAMGARKRLWLMPGRPWTALERGAKEEADFIDACATAHIQASRGRTQASGRGRNFYYPGA